MKTVLKMEENSLKPISESEDVKVKAEGVEVEQVEELIRSENVE